MAVFARSTRQAVRARIFGDRVGFFPRLRVCHSHLLFSCNNHRRRTDHDFQPRVTDIEPSIFSSFGIFLSRQFIYGVPSELYDAAKIDGSSDWGIYRNVILPLTRPLLSVLAIFTFLGTFNAYLWPLVILNDMDKMTLPLVLSRIADRFGAQDYQAVMAGGVLISLPPLIVFLIFQRNFVRGIALTGIK
jgi:ABC-type glycerol-3-phosphate transport system permease component